MFLLVALPLVSIGAMLAVDFTRVLVVGRNLNNVTGAAALAGAQQYVPNRAELDVGRAQVAPRQLINRAQATQATRGAQILDVETVVEGDVVKVTTTYKVADLVFIPLVRALLSVDGESSGRYTITRTATLCVPDDAPGNLVSCKRPVR